MAKIDRQKYASMYGPTVGDKIRLANTELFAEIERDFTVYGEENKFGGGKTMRDGMAQSATHLRDEGVLDLVITNATIIDYWGIVKADIGIKDGKIDEADLYGTASFSSFLCIFSAFYIDFLWIVPYQCL